MATKKADTETTAPGPTEADIKKMNVHQRIHGIMGDLAYIQKTGELQFTAGGAKTPVATHDDVSASVHKMLVKYRVTSMPSIVSAKQDGNRTELMIRVRFTNIDEPEDFTETDSFGYGVDGGDKGPGKATSYAIKYAYLKAFVLETGEDSDNDGLVKHERGVKQPAPETPATTNGGFGGQSSPTPATGMWWPEAMWRDKYQLEGVQKAAEEAGLTKEQIDKYVIGVAYEGIKKDKTTYPIKTPQYLQRDHRVDMELRINTGKVAEWFDTPPAPKEGVDDIPDNYLTETGEMATADQLAQMDAIKGEVADEKFQAALKVAGITSREATTSEQADKFIGHINIPF